MGIVVDLDTLCEGRQNSGGGDAAAASLTNKFVDVLFLSLGYADVGYTVLFFSSSFIIPLASSGDNLSNDLNPGL